MAISELQIALVGAGVAAVAAVWGYNVWQERRHRRSAETLLKGRTEDVLLAGAAPVADQEMPTGERLEPTLSPPEDIDDAVSPPLPADAGHEDGPEAVAGDLAAPPAPVAYARSPAAAAPAEDCSPADAMADCIVRFTLPSPVAASAVWAAQAGWSASISKPLMWLGRNAGDLAWRFVGTEAAGRYAEWLVALPLADRRGPISDAEVSAFRDGIEETCRQLGVTVALPSRAEVLQRALDLDALCASVDIQFSLHVVEASGGTFAGTKLRGVCEAAGLSLGEDGLFHFVDDAGREQFALGNFGSERFAADTIRSLATYGITLTLDVPRVADGVQAFARMIATAQQLARGLGGVLVDMQRAPLAEAMIGGIRAKTVEIQQKMKAAGIEPGSARALRLFS